jgi:uncharacterized RDD family membrane protein YckC
MSEQPPGGLDHPEAPLPPPAYPVTPSVMPAAYPAAASTGPLQPSGPAPGLAYAGFGWRLLGYVLDSLILFTIEAPVSIPAVIVPVAQYYQAHPAAPGHTLATLPADLTNRMVVLGLLGAVLTALYFGGLVAWQGRTLGQRAMGMYVVRADDGGRLTAYSAYLRAVIFWGPGVLGPLPTVGSVAGLIQLIVLFSVAWVGLKQGGRVKLGRRLLVQRVPL